MRRRAAAPRAGSVRTSIVRRLRRPRIFLAGEIAELVLSLIPTRTAPSMSEVRWAQRSPKWAEAQARVQQAQQQAFRLGVSPALRFAGNAIDTATPFDETSTLGSIGEWLTDVPAATLRGIGAELARLAEGEIRVQEAIIQAARKARARKGT